MKITINNIEYKLKYTIRALFVFEKITNETFTGKQLIDYYVLFYSILLSNNGDTFKMTFDEFISICDEQPDLFKNFIEFLNNEFAINNQFITDNTEADTNKKKV